MSTLEVNSIQPLSSGSTITLGASGKTLNIPSGCTISNSGTASGFGGGKINQIVQGTTSTVVAFTGSTYSDTGLSATITPSATDSKILCTGFAPCQIAGNNGEVDGALRFLRDSTTLYDPFVQNLALYTNTVIDFRWYVPFSYLDTPNSTSSLVYKFQGRTNASGSTFRFSFQNKPSYLILQEVLA
tara:strand:+ start:183 stop:740 length:558 start_codon:yes stop_codon:yes gene_type:complete